MTAASGPGGECPLCPRLVAFRNEARQSQPHWHNGPVPSFGDEGVPLLIVGLAPGLRGANRTGRPFTGDHAGELLFATLLRFGLAEGSYGRAADDGLRLNGCRISNAVRCVPPGNRPTPAEVRTCNRFLREEIAGMLNLRVCIALGAIAHDAVLSALGVPRKDCPFSHGALHHPMADLRSGVILADSYHCSRQNTNTGRLTAAMFESVFATVLPLLAS